MAGPNKPSNQNNNQNDNKKKAPIGFLGIVLWAVVLVLLLNTCMSSLQNSSTVEVRYSEFRQWVEAGYVDQVEMESDGYYFTVKEGTPPLTEYADKITQSLSEQQRNLFNSLLGGNMQQALEDSVTFVTAPVTDYTLVPLLNDMDVDYGTKRVSQYMLSVMLQTILPILIMVVAMVFIYRYIFKKTGSGGIGGVGGVGKANAKVYVEKKTGVTFRDVAGQDEAKESLVEIIDFLHNPQKYTEIGAKLPKGALLVGPPGTGKTSIARSIAEAMHKKYVRICLGGVRDEAEIRGHRKTYVGAMPGRITAALQQAGVSNPLMLLDEIDKTSSDYKGDTSAALLEVLDPEQNSRFMDHYIEVPQDLSEVLFIATANDVQGIPRPLLDRMELIEIAGYTENEKEHIAKEHLIPKQMEENGIEKGKLTIQSAALKKIINNYTKEAGVRNLERTIGQICRKTARLIMEEDKKKVTVTSKNLSDFLGKEHFNYLMANKKDEIGISRGLAWTQVGGDTLQIEVNVMPGKGELMLTGQLGDVMKESAQAGITYIRSIASDYKVEPEFFQENDIHVHIPEGAVPKDGPSAGITMATAILSAIIKKPVRADLAMTGEITLRGRVLPIGGLKEKLLAAKYAKIKEVLVPAENKPDIQELDKEITGGLTITFVSSMKEVLNKALV